ncbi:MAG: Holliday junction branch migration protein RuvA [Clostridia bacterium]|nr:Holliday junction branch migration protein RuvA [Clostridia bacterium]
MFSYIKGSLECVNSAFAVIENGGIGYKINMPFRESSALPLNGEVKIYIYTHIREDAFELFGFVSEESLKLFELLLSVSGVGPKAATAILDTFSPSEIILAISSGDSKSITKASGIGAKTAQRIVLELADKLKGFSPDSLPQVNMPSSVPGGMSDEAIGALVSLGYSEAAAKSAVLSVKNASNVEELIKLALKSAM